MIKYGIDYKITVFECDRVQRNFWFHLVIYWTNVGLIFECGLCNLLVVYVILSDLLRLCSVY